MRFERVRESPIAEGISEYVMTPVLLSNDNIVLLYVEFDSNGANTVPSLEIPNKVVPPGKFTGAIPRPDLNVKFVLAVSEPMTKSFAPAVP